ncbi:LysR family transcriptional regulator [Reinekea forsetii]|nr:LysR family transcriptional regulator [Reinekea forsetii]
MDLHSLEAFLAVAETGSFSRAGEKLFLTQPAISKRVSNLEQQLATPLFDRIGRDVYLTEAGKLLQTRATRIVNDIKDAQQTVVQLNEDHVTELSMASSHHIGLHYLGPILKQFSAAHPDAQLDVHFLESEQAIDALLKRDIELALTTIPSPLNKALIGKTLWTDTLHFVVAKDHPLAQRQGKLRLNQLASVRAILPDKQTTTFQIIEQTFQNHHIPLNRVLTVNYLETIKELVTHGLGWSLLPTSLIGHDELCILNIDKVALNRQLGIIYHRKRTPSRGVRHLIEIAETNSIKPTS